MGIIRKEFEENGKEYLSHYLIGAIKSVISSEVATDKEKVEKIESLLSEYDEIKAEDK